jgi:hypothetical protein
MSFGPSRNNRGAGNSGEQLVQFRLTDAQRISNAVTWVEGQRRPRKPSVLPRAAGSAASTTDSSVSVYLGTYYGSWPKGSSKVVYAGTATYSVSNPFATIDRAGSCAFAKTINSNVFILLAAECEEG